MSRNKSQSYTNDPDNIELVRLIDELAETGMSQQVVAELLKISPGQLSRVKKGERHAAWKHIRELRKQLRASQENRRVQQMATPSNIAKIDNTILKGLSSQSAVKAFRDLLWAEAARLAVSVTKVSISSDTSTADGGIDASILDPVACSHAELFSGERRFQIKTGDFQPWRPSEVKQELFGKNPQLFDNLGAAIQRMLRENKEFVVVCFGVDPVDEKLRLAKENFKRAFKACGFSNARVEVWGQTQLIGLFQKYSALCLSLRGHDQQGFRFWTSWVSDADMQPQLHYGPEQYQLVEELRNDLLSGRFPHLRLIGEPGVGKSRMALEITRAQYLAPITLYIRDGRSLLKSSFLNELIQGSPGRFVLLVVDECPPQDRAELWNILKTRSERVRLITIDHGPDNSIDDKTRVVEVKPVEPEQIVSILAEYGIEKHRADRWAEFCEGCPRVAHVLGENLRHNRVDLLQSTGTVNVWDRFVVGHDAPNSDEVQLRKTVLRCISLFERFGFESPVNSEAKFISQMASECDSRLTWPRFQEVVGSLRQRRIIQGATTLYITPRLLHVHLYREFWQSYGSGFDIAEKLQKMPPQLQYWFVAMLKYTDDSQAANAAVAKLLGPSGFFPTNSFPDTRDAGQLLLSLAVSSPKAALKCLQRTIGHMSDAQLLELRESRQHIVWALERLAVRDEFFASSAELLLKLAETENATNGNNATGTFRQLFSLSPGGAPTQAAPSRRNNFLKEAMDSNVPLRRRVALETARAAFSSDGGFRIVGPEHQGLRETFDFWYPKTYGELWEAYRDLWDMIAEKLSIWHGEERTKLIEAIIASAGLALSIPLLNSSVLQTLESLAGDPDTNFRELIRFIQVALKFRKNELDELMVARLGQLRSKLDGSDFKSRLRRYVKYATTDDSFDDNLQASNTLDEKLKELAHEGLNSPNLLEDELGWLLCESSGAAFGFGFYLAQNDPQRNLLATLVRSYESLPNNASVSLFSGYLASMSRQNRDKWESAVLSLSANPAIRCIYADLVISSGLTDALASKVIELFRSGMLNLKCLERWWFRGELRVIAEPIFQEFIELQLVKDRSDLWCNAVQMFHTRYLQGQPNKKLPNIATFNLLTSETMVGKWTGNSIGYYWSRLASAFVSHYPERMWEFFRAVLRASVKQWNLLADLETPGEQALKQIFESDPEMGWDCIAEVILISGERSFFGIRHWLDGANYRLIGNDGPGAIQLVPSSKLFAWVDENLQKHGPLLIDALPKTLDGSCAGRLTRDFIAKYGKDNSLFNLLSCHFHNRSWMGSASDFYRKLREKARDWLIDEKSPVVVRWIENYIDGLSCDIERAEILEERKTW